MNPQNDSSKEPKDDPLLEEMLSPLKQLEPPLEARIANRQAVSAALGALDAVNRRQPWWRRSISIPVPLAAALAVLMVVALASSFRGGQEQSPGHVAAPAVTTSVSNEPPIVQFYETETYLCGVGRLDSESFYGTKD